MNSSDKVQRSLRPSAGAEEKSGLASHASVLLSLIGSISVALPLLVYAYLGTFSRYRADDYCETIRLLGPDNFWQASVLRYVEWTGRYSTLLFVQVSEWFGMPGMVYLTAAALLVWLAGLTWGMAEVGRLSGLHWKNWLSFVLAGMAIFFSLYRAPNLYQILFWRSGMSSYLAPLVLLSCLAAFILYRLRVPASRFGRIGSSLLVFSGVFIVGGASETVNVLQITMLAFALLACYWWRTKVRKEAFFLLATALTSAILSLVVVSLSPGNLVRLDATAPIMPDWFPLGDKSLTFAFQFIWDSFKVSPLPALLALLMPFLLFYGLPYAGLRSSLSPAGKAGWLLLIIPLGVLIAITISFAPSAYAKSFPSARVRFPALFLLTLMLVAEGGLAGYLLSQVRSPSSSALLRALVFSLLILTFLYPLRAAIRIYSLAPRYRSEAAAWDARDREIRQAVAAGATDLVVVQLDTPGGVQEYKGNELFWVNRCAAAYYGLRSLRAP
jgi:hypothetical protein